MATEARAQEDMAPLAEMFLNPAFLARMPEAAKSRLTRLGELRRTGNAEAIAALAAESEAWKNELYNATPGELTGYDCPKCQNRGDFRFTDKYGNPSLRECECMKKRRYLRNIRESGLSEMLSRYTFEAWQCREPWQRDALEAVTRYAQNPQGWLCLSGTPGTGKTHLCTALCGELLERGLSVSYMLWKDVSTKAKAVVNDEAYEAIVSPLKRVRVLYIDDFWKAGRAVDRATGNRVKAEPTVGDVNLAFDIINARYCDSGLLTIFSTELTIGEMLNVDEAVGSRIAERARGGRYQDLSGKNRNWRMR